MSSSETPSRTPPPPARSGIDVAVGDAPGNDGPPISPLNPGSMHRAEDDADAFATSPEFHERPRTASYTAPAATATTSSEGPPETSRD